MRKAHFGMRESGQKRTLQSAMETRPELRLLTRNVTLHF